MESLVRLAEDKYLKSNIVNNLFEATTKLINEQSMPIFNKYNS